jgi:hypothetical protein
MDAAILSLELNAVWLVGCGRAARPETGLRTRRHHQHHGSCAPDQVERHETPDPLRSNALDSRFQCVQQAPGGGPIVMINIGSPGIRFW